MFLYLLVFVFLFFLVGYKLLTKVENSLFNMAKRENFTNESDNLEKPFKNECKEKQDTYNKLLSTPVAVNIPLPEYKNNFYIGENDYSNQVVEKEPNSFPIYQYKYDGVFNANKITKNDYQKIKWNNDDTLNSNLKYNNKLVRVPEKTLLPGQQIISINNWNNNSINNYNGTLINKDTQKDYECNGSYSPFSDVYIT